MAQGAAGGGCVSMLQTHQNSKLRSTEFIIPLRAGERPRNGNFSSFPAAATAATMSHPRRGGGDGGPFDDDVLSCFCKIVETVLLSRVQFDVTHLSPDPDAVSKVCRRPVSQDTHTHTHVPPLPLPCVPRPHTCVCVFCVDVTLSPPHPRPLPLPPRSLA